MKIRRLTAKRFRVFDSLEWHPGEGLNCLIGPGDAGKSSILDAISLVLRPVPSGPAREFDYHLRRTELGFEIELVVGQLTEELLASFAVPPLWGWDGPAQKLVNAPEDGLEEVLVLVARGTADLDIEHSLLLPNTDEARFGPDRRKKFGLFSSGSNDRRDLSLARGSLLARSLTSEDVRGNVVQSIREASAGLNFPQAVLSDLASLQSRLALDGLTVEQLTLSLSPPQSSSILGLIALSAGSGVEAVPLAEFGQGTRRMVAFNLAEHMADTEPIVVLDEVEAGLEPFRQRHLMKRLRQTVGTNGQAFLTTHSPTVVSTLSSAELSYVRPNHEITRVSKDLNSGKSPFVRNDPESLLCQHLVLAEGPTELGFYQSQIERRMKQLGLSPASLGIHFTDGTGQPKIFRIAHGVRETGISVTCILDNHPEHKTACDRAERAGIILSCHEYESLEMAIAKTITKDQLKHLIFDAEQPGTDHDSRLHQITLELGKQCRPNFEALLEMAGSEEILRRTFGTVSNKRKWYKSTQDSIWLASYLDQTEFPELISSQVDSIIAKMTSHISPVPSHDCTPYGTN